MVKNSFYCIFVNKYFAAIQKYGQIRKFYNS